MHIYFIVSAGWMQTLAKTVVIGISKHDRIPLFRSHFSLYHPEITLISR